MLFNYYCLFCVNLNLGHISFEKTLKLLKVNPFHTYLRLHRLKGRLSSLYSVSINISYRICIDFIIEEDKIILIDIGKHDQAY